MKINLNAGCRASLYNSASSTRTVCSICGKHMGFFDEHRAATSSSIQAESAIIRYSYNTIYVVDIMFYDGMFPS